MKRLVTLLLVALLSAACTAPQTAARTAADGDARLIEPGRFTWDEDVGKICAYPDPTKSPGSWWTHVAALELPGLEGAAARFCQWRGESIMQRWAVHLRVDRGITRLYESPRLGDELNWYDVATHPNRPGFALVVGLIEHAGPREWSATAAIIPYENGFGDVRPVLGGIFGGTALAADRLKLYGWHGQHANSMEGVVINCPLCPQHMTVTEYTWGEHWEARPGKERRTRLPYTPGDSKAAQELPVHPRALEVYNQGLALVGRGELEKARNVLSAAFSLDPTFADAANEQGYACILQQKWAEAVVPLEEALKVDSLHPGARFNLALALSRLGKYREARQHALYAVLLQPGRDGPKALYDEIRRAMGS